MILYISNLRAQEAVEVLLLPTLFFFANQSLRKYRIRAYICNILKPECAIYNSKKTFCESCWEFYSVSGFSNRALLNGIIFWVRDLQIHVTCFRDRLRHSEIQQKIYLLNSISHKSYFNKSSKFSLKRNRVIKVIIKYALEFLNRLSHAFRD